MILTRIYKWFTTGPFNGKWILSQKDPTKQAQEVIFSCKTKRLSHLSLVFNNAKVTWSIYQKHLGIVLDSMLTFENQLRMVTTK